MKLINNTIGGSSISRHQKAHQGILFLFMSALVLLAVAFTLEETNSEKQAEIVNSSDSTIDSGDQYSIHPSIKTSSGRRLRRGGGLSSSRSSTGYGSGYYASSGRSA